MKSRWDEFIVFHDFAVQEAAEESFALRWKEFSAFAAALRAGHLGYPAELFAGEAFTSELLIATWVRYQQVEMEYALWADRQERMASLGLEQRIPEEVAKLRAAGDAAALTDEELAFKVRRDLYYAAHEEELYVFTEPEIRRELAALRPLVQFRNEFAHCPRRVRPIDIPRAWRGHSARFPSAVELGCGRKKMFEVAEACDDYNILDEFFTKEFCEKNKYYLAKAKTVWTDWRKPEKHYVIETRSFDRIKRKLLFQFTNFQQPVIYVIDANYNSSGELYLRHEHTGVDLDYFSKGGMYVRDVLQRLFRIWGGKKRVYLQTVVTAKDEDKQWWWHWHAGDEKSSAEFPAKLKGRLTLYSFGLDAHGNEQFLKQELGDVDFDEPF